MDPSTLQHYMTLLAELKATLEAELEQSRDDTAPVEVDGRMGRISRGDAMQVQQMALDMKRRREERLLRVQTALQRVEAGTYGLCGRCRKPIGPDRLDAFPDVVLCVRCAS
jgi:DnaK suppressor protein